MIRGGLYRKYIVNGHDGFPSLCKQLREIQKIDPTAIFNVPEEPVNCANPKTINDIKIYDQPCGDPNDKFFPQFYPMHNHADYKVINNGVYPRWSVNNASNRYPRQINVIIKRLVS